MKKVLVGFDSNKIKVGVHKYGFLREKDLNEQEMYYRVHIPSYPVRSLDVFITVETFQQLMDDLQGTTCNAKFILALPST